MEAVFRVRRRCVVDFKCRKVQESNIIYHFFQVITRTPVKTVRHTTHTFEVPELPISLAGGSKEDPASAGILSEDEKPEFIHIPLSPNPKVSNVFIFGTPYLVLKTAYCS